MLSAISNIVGPPRWPEKGNQVANISESSLEQKLEVQPKKEKILQSISQKPSSAPVEPSELQADSTATSEPKRTEPVVPEPHKTSNVLKFGILAGLALLLIAGIWWWVSQQPVREVRQEKVSIRLRSEPRTVTSEEASKTFGLDESGRPIEYIENQFEDRGKVVFDRATGLMWQKSGSQNTLTYEKAQKYIEQLNREGFAGYSDWRLPTIPELMSLLEPQKQENGLYIDPIFDADQRWCWSADKGSPGSAWYVYFYYGNVYWGNLYNNLYVCGVRS